MFTQEIALIMLFVFNRDNITHCIMLQFNRNFLKVQRRTLPWFCPLS